MKKYILLFATAIAMAFSSCTNDNIVSITHEVEILVDPYTVLKPFPGISIGGDIYGLDMMDETLLMMQCLIYDENGSLVNNVTGVFEDYTAKGTFKFNVAPNEKYTIVTLSYAILVDEDGDVYSPYEVLDYEKLDRLSVTQLSSYAYYSTWSILGLNITEVDASKPQVTIELKPATAMVELGFYDAHSKDYLGVDKLIIGYDNKTAFDLKGVNPNYFEFSDPSYYRVVDLDLTAVNGSYITDIVNILPTKDMWYVGSAYIGNDEVLTIEPNYNIDIDAGNTYIILCDFNEEIITAECTTSRTRSSEYSEINVSRCKANIVDLYNIIK